MLFHQPNNAFTRFLHILFAQTHHYIVSIYMTKNNRCQSTNKPKPLTFNFFFNSIKSTLLLSFSLRTNLSFLENKRRIGRGNTENENDECEEERNVPGWWMIS
ncbi:hypothetical protein BRARA_H00645 [Brassica rapa]|uniref:Uncharacterized protein n=1 Tax=Brassica campestris TaxID=3711 RepID=A0A397YAG1_BRACM|nr:hypothetical protein BRARA_H00645 [Brassica rapa]